jgi:hypothetical protein
MDQYVTIDDKIQKGYELHLENDCLGGCDKWLEAWDEIKQLFVETEAKNIYELNKKYNWTQYISNYAQDLEMELHNAGVKDKTYNEKRIIYCRELLQWCGTDELIISNTRRGMAEGYYESGDPDSGEQLFTEWLRDDPDWGWGYIGWSDCYYRLKYSGPQYEKAEEILLIGYAREGLRDRINIVERLVTLYEDMGNSNKAKEFKKIFSELQYNEPKGSYYYKPTPVKSEKIGRNDPCPCGSGQKYKKCCGA